MFNKDFFNQIVYQHKKNDPNESSIIEKVFECENVNIHTIHTVDYLKSESKKINSIINGYVDSLRGGEGIVSDEDIYLVCTSSLLYSILVDGVRIPTKNNNHSDSFYIYVCSINIDEQEDYIKNKSTLTLLGFLNIDTGVPVVISEDVYNELTRANNLNISVLSSHKFKSKRMDIGQISNPLDILSLSKQATYKKIVHTILSYGALAASDPGNTERFDNLQHYIIDQQVRLGLYNCLKPLFSECYIRFNKQKNIVDNTGNLFFRIVLPNAPLSDVKIGLTEVFLSTIDNGFFVSSPNLDGRFNYSEDVSEREHHSLYENLSKSSSFNILYPILFRSMLSQFTSELVEIDDLIIGGEYEKLENYLKERL